MITIHSIRTVGKPHPQDTRGQSRLKRVTFEQRTAMLKAEVNAKMKRQQTANLKREQR